MKLPKGLYKPLKIAKLFSIPISLFLLSSLMFVSACLSISSVKPYSLQTRLILEIGLSAFKSIFTSQLESVSIKFTTSSVDELISKIAFSKL